MTSPLHSPHNRRTMRWLAFWHMLVIVLSNYLVQFAFTIGPVHTTWGAFTFPIVFLTTDLTVRIFGASLARRIIFVVMGPALAISYAVSVLFHDGAWLGWDALAVFNPFVGRIALASFLAYCLGQLLDVLVFSRLRALKVWWAAPSASTLVGGALDTLVFFSVAFYASSDEFMRTHWPEIAWVDYAVKIMAGAMIFLPLYRVLLSRIMRRLARLSPLASA